MTTRTTSRVGMAAATALLTLASMSMHASASAADKEQPGRCYGINNCKGESLCATSRNDCKGLNECKGKGVLVKTATECKALGGTPTEKE